MIKPILYHSFEEKEVIERELMAKIPLRRRLAASKALMNIFYEAGKSSKPTSSKKLPKKTSKK